ncbi:hypothetical protein FA15DRAFT_676336 [Coprinopsis marcescibilis]|uniref:RING-type domain-containing protein n=1 Tax=Coprinopsis marcescibilis TaxID=230819 RepID=A0A5C3KAD6_COPMA|nr:hypothetical protein FA15DRAFT_676336 [Coprinopsis marcescibilis]
MSGTQCSICLERFLDPVSIPCGHVYCSQCLVDHINSSQSSNPRRLTSTCPTCRTEFQLKTPDLKPLPRKLHPFFLPHIRRVFFDDAAEQRENPEEDEMKALRAQLAMYDEQVKVLQTRERHLMQACRLTAESAEEYMRRERVAKGRLREAHVQVNQMAGDVVRAERAVDVAEERERETASALAKAVDELANFRFECRANHVSKANLRVEEVSRRRSLGDENVPDDTDIYSPMKRMVRPLPRRRCRASLDMNSADATSKRPRLSQGSGRTLRQI